MKTRPDPHLRHRFPSEIISHALWLHHVFSLGLRDVELILAERGVVLSYETVRRWCKKFGASFADRLRRERRLAWQTEGQVVIDWPSFGGAHEHAAGRMITLSEMRHLISRWRAERGFPLADA